MQVSLIVSGAATRKRIFPHGDPKTPTLWAGGWLGGWRHVDGIESMLQAMTLQNGLGFNYRAARSLPLGQSQCCSFFDSSRFPRSSASKHFPSFNISLLGLARLVSLRVFCPPCPPSSCLVRVLCSMTTRPLSTLSSRSPSNRLPSPPGHGVQAIVCRVLESQARRNRSEEAAMGVGESPPGGPPSGVCRAAPVTT